MEIKLLEIRDRATFFMVLCVDMNPANAFERRALRYYGHPCDGIPNILMTHARCSDYATNDPYGWTGPARTYLVAHEYIIDHWNELKEGDIIDVQFIAGETSVKQTVSALDWKPEDDT